MRSTLFATLILCCCLSAGCESLNSALRKPGTSPSGTPEQLTQDAKRRQASEQKAARSPSADSLAQQPEKGRQQANFPPTGPAGNAGLESLLAQASQAERSNQNANAKALYEQVLQASPQNPQAHHRLGILADQEGHYAEAQNHYQLALSKEPGNPVLLSDIGYSLYSQDRLDEAEQYLQESLRVQPNNEIARNNLAQVYVRRGQQTGSQADYELAREQFALASGTQAVNDQARNLNAAPPAAEERKGFPNPFKNRNARDKVQTAQAGRELKAPDPTLNKETQKFIKDFEALKQDAIANGSYKSAANGANPRDPRTNATLPSNVPIDQLNNELTKIDQDAQLRRDLVLREANAYPNNRRSIRQDNGPRGNREQPGDIAQTGGWEELPTSRGPQSTPQGMPNINPSQSRYPLPVFNRFERGGNAQNTGGRNRNRPQDDSHDMNQEGNSNDLIAPANGSDPRFSFGGPSGDANSNQSWNQQAGSALSKSWPDATGSANQFDAGGDRWDGRSVMRQDRVGSGTDQMANGSDVLPESDFGAGGFPNQRPQNGNQPAYNQNRGSVAAQPVSNQRPPVQAPAGWGNNRAKPDLGGRFDNQSNFNGADDGRETAAQIALDAGVGEMFPGNAVEQPPPNSRRQGRAPYGPRNSRPDQGSRFPRGNSNNSWPSVDPQNQTLQAPAATPGGMPQGGAGMMSASEYAPRQAGFRTGGYPQGSAPDGGDNFNGTTESNAAWGENSGNYGTNSRNTVRPRRPVYKDDSTQYGSGFAPDRANSGSSQNFGAPPMNYGR